MLDYRDLRAKEDLTLPGGFSWSDIESLMIKIRKIKSHVFDEGQPIAFHQGAFMDAATQRTQLTNSHLSDDTSVRQLKTKTIALNRYYWKVDNLNSGRINLQKHSHIIRNGQGDAVLALDSSPARNEVRQYKNVKKANSNLKAGRRNTTDTNDVFVLF